MNKVFRSSFWELFKKFIFVLLWVLFLLGIIGVAVYFYFKLDLEVLINPLVLSISSVVVTLIAVFFSFMTKTASVVVDEDSVNIIKGNRVYRSFPRESNEFKYNVHRTRGVFIHRSLRVVEKKRNKWKDYRLFFSRKTFEKLIAFIDEKVVVEAVAEKEEILEKEE